MSNRAPQINPRGTRFTRVPMYVQVGGRDQYGLFTKQFEKVMRVMGAYIKAEYAVTMTTDVIYNHHYATIVCEARQGIFDMDDNFTRNALRYRG